MKSGQSINIENRSKRLKGCSLLHIYQALYFTTKYLHAQKKFREVNDSIYCPEL